MTNASFWMNLIISKGFMDYLKEFKISYQQYSGLSYQEEDNYMYAAGILLLIWFIYWNR